MGNSILFWSWSCSLYFGIKHQAADQYTSQAQGGANGPLPYLYYDYDKDDIRRDITCIPYEWSKELVDGKSYQQLRGINNGASVSFATSG